ncbi:DUF427 domain-containing protein [Amycolatopsis sp. NBC_00348]|uniref:DUF427 domain-containing protein n=1 Tax=Amycolatopsis sp. NBC_00348 TaxID=2975956 RepID=UPI002E257FEB
MSDLAASRRHPVPAGELTYEPGERRVRGVIGETTVVDSTHPVLVWEPGRPVPLYAFPAGDVRTDLLTPGAAGRDRPGVRTWYDLTLDGRRFPALAWDYDVSGEVPELAGHLALDWFGRTSPGVEHWYEEEEEIFVHPRDPYKRVDALPGSRWVRVSIGGVLVAETRRPVLLFETRLPIRYYIPPEDVHFDRLTPVPLQTSCPYKGTARYWSTPDAPNAAWAYPAPIPAAGPIKDHVAFYNEIVDIEVDGELLERPVTPFTSRLAAG